MAICPSSRNFYSVVSKCCAGLERVCDKSLGFEAELILSTVTGLAVELGSPLLSSSPFLLLLP